jgi:hypothetical protein
MNLIYLISPIVTAQEERAGRIAAVPDQQRIPRVITRDD